tara:strand:+ start:3935 stop:5467 length:1533 start_codon:yes stop_codon:yes gene_type:complete
MKAMIERGMRNKEIQFFFNRPDRAVNSGRISGIKSGEYSNSSEIEPASQDDLDRFLSEFKPTEVSATVGVPLETKERVSPASSPLASNVLRTMFRKDKKGNWYFKLGESDQHECKQSFGLKHAHTWMRPIAALANNVGGYVFFGVKDSKEDDGKASKDPYRVVGLKNREFEEADPVEFTLKLKATFDPTPRIERTVISFGPKKVGVIYVHPHDSRPLIATKSEGKIKEGDILFRYPGQSSRIKYSDLRSILDERDRHSREQILPLVQKVLSSDPQSLMIANLDDGTLSGVDQSLVIGEDLIERIKFIREGEFDEKEGAATLRLVGDVKAIGSEVRKTFVTPFELVQDFLSQKQPSDPKEYIRCGVEGGNGAWLPIHFYARKAGMDNAELAKFISKTSAPLKRKKAYADRATGKTKAFKKAGGTPGEILERLENGETIEIPDLRTASQVGIAVAGLEQKPDLPLDTLLSLLDQCANLALSAENRSALSPIRRGIARVDELFFGEDFEIAPD